MDKFISHPLIVNCELVAIFFDQCQIFGTLVMIDIGQSGFKELQEPNVKSRPTYKGVEVITLVV